MPTNMAPSMALKEARLTAPKNGWKWRRSRGGSEWRFSCRKRACGCANSYAPHHTQHSDMLGVFQAGTCDNTCKARRMKHMGCFLPE